MLDFFTPFLSPDTGWIHVDPNSSWKRKDVTPLYENLLYVLALMRSKEKEKFERALTHLSKILSFSLPEGLPFTLHSYPVPSCGFYSLLMLYPLLLIERHFKHLIPQTIRKDLVQLKEALWRRSLLCPDANESTLHRYRLFCLNKAFGLGERELLCPSIDPFLFSGDDLGHIDLLSCDADVPPPFDPLLFFNAERGRVFTAPKFMHTVNGVPKRTLLDLIFKPRATAPKKQVELITKEMMQAALIFHEREVLSSENKTPFLLRKSQENEKGSTLYPLYVSMQEKTVDLSALFVLKGGTVFHEEGASFLAALKPIDEPIEKPLTEISVFFTKTPSSQVLLKGRQATCFTPFETLEVQADNKTHHLKIELVSGSFSGTGHIQEVNRPLEEESSSCLYDTKIFLRTVSRSREVTLRISLS